MLTELQIRTVNRQTLINVTKDTAVVLTEQICSLPNVITIISDLVGIIQQDFCKLESCLKMLTFTTVSQLRTTKIALNQLILRF